MARARATWAPTTASTSMKMCHVALALPLVPVLAEQTAALATSPAMPAALAPALRMALGTGQRQQQMRMPAAAMAAAVTSIHSCVKARGRRRRRWPHALLGRRRARSRVRRAVLALGQALLLVLGQAGALRKAGLQLWKRWTAAAQLVLALQLLVQAQVRVQAQVLPVLVLLQAQRKPVLSPSTRSIASSWASMQMAAVKTLLLVQLQRPLLPLLLALPCQCLRRASLLLQQLQLPGTEQVSRAPPSWSALLWPAASRPLRLACARRLRALRPSSG